MWKGSVCTLQAAKDSVVVQENQLLNGLVLCLKETLL